MWVRDIKERVKKKERERINVGEFALTLLETMRVFVYGVGWEVEAAVREKLLPKQR